MTISMRALLAFAVVAMSVISLQAADTCSSCTFPCAPDSRVTLQLIPRKGKTVPSQQFLSVVRDTTGGLSIRQGLRCRWIENGQCRDTLVPLSDVEGVNMAGSLGKVPPVMARIMPAKLYEKTTMPVIPSSWLEVGGYLAYGGSDKSNQGTIPVGFDNVLFGGELLVNPFGHIYGENLDLAIGGGVMSESSRLRFDGMAQLRWNFGGFKRRSKTSFVPSQCTFTCNPAAIDTVHPNGDFVEVPVDGDTDPSVYLAREVVVERNSFRPFLFAEGGILVPSSFEGNGRNPSVNPEEYAEFFAGLGAGIPIADMISISLAYRYWRLNLRTPCPTCVDVNIVNTNHAHTLLLKLAYHLDW